MPYRAKTGQPYDGLQTHAYMSPCGRAGANDLFACEIDSQLVRLRDPLPLRRNGVGRSCLCVQVYNSANTGIIGSVCDEHLDCGD
jgi:hypothetical protein